MLTKCQIPCNFCEQEITFAYIQIYLIFRLSNYSMFSLHKAHSMASKMCKYIVSEDKDWFLYIFVPTPWFSWHAFLALCLIYLYGFEMTLTHINVQSNWCNRMKWSRPNFIVQHMNWYTINHITSHKGLHADSKSKDDKYWSLVRVSVRVATWTY